MRSLSADRHKCPSLELKFFSPKLKLTQYTAVNIYAVLITTPEAASGVNRLRNFHYGYMSGWKDIGKTKKIGHGLCTLVVSMYTHPCSVFLHIIRTAQTHTYMNLATHRSKEGFINKLTFLIHIIHSVICYLLQPVITVDHLHQRQDGFGCGDKHSQ